MAEASVVAAAYEFWHDTWFRTLRQLDAIEHLASDDFARQDTILVLSHGGRCIAVTCLRWMNRSNGIGRDDSYFRTWPREALESIGPMVAITSNTAIAEDYRRARVECGDLPPRRLSEITLALAVRRFETTGLPELVGVARNNRKMDDVAAALGFETIGRVVMHGIDSDIMRLRRGKPREWGREVDRIWARRR
jgi:hypothetical protein